MRIVFLAETLWHLYKKVLLQNHFSCEIIENKSVLTVKSIYVKKTSVQIPQITKSGILEQTFSV